MIGEGRESQKDNDLFFTCGLIEYIARKTKNIRSEVVNKLGKARLSKIYDLADVYHCDNIDRISDDYIEDAMLDIRRHNETSGEEQERLWALPKERWEEQLDNYLLFWREDQGCWYAGIRKRDLDQPNPVVYFNDQDTMYHWGPFADSVQSFLLATVLENLEEDADPDVMEDPVEIQKVLSEAGVDFQRLQEPYPFPGGRFCHTCLDTETNTLYVYGEPAENRPAYLKVFKPDEEE